MIGKSMFLGSEPPNALINDYRRSFDSNQSPFNAIARFILSDDFSKKTIFCLGRGFDSASLSKS